MSAQSLPVPPVPATPPEAAPFFAGALAGRLTLPRCERCSTVVWYPRAYCPECGSLDVTWFDASGRGVVYSVVLNRRGLGPYADAGEYLVAYVELDEGPRVLTNLVDVPDPANVEIGAPVQAVFHDSGEGSALLRFRLAT